MNRILIIILITWSAISCFRWITSLDQNEGRRHGSITILLMLGAILMMVPACLPFDMSKPIGKTKITTDEVFFIVVVLYSLILTLNLFRSLFTPAESKDDNSEEEVQENIAIEKRAKQKREELKRDIYER